MQTARVSNGVHGGCCLVERPTSLVELLVCSLVCVLVSLSVPAVDRLSGAAWAEAELEVNPPLPLPLRCLLRGRRCV